MKISKKTFDEISQLASAILDKEGREVNNPVPLLIRSESAEESLESKIQRMVRRNLAMEAAEQGYETFEEANDFEVDDDFDMDEPDSAYILQDEYPVMKEEEPPEVPASQETVLDDVPQKEEKETPTDDAESQKTGGTT